MHAFGSNIGTLNVGASSNANIYWLYSWTGQYQPINLILGLSWGRFSSIYWSNYILTSPIKANVGTSWQGR